MNLKLVNNNYENVFVCVYFSLKPLKAVEIVFFDHPGIHQVWKFMAHSILYQIWGWNFLTLTFVNINNKVVKIKQESINGTNESIC